jgi:hypothetical protein
LPNQRQVLTFDISTVPLQPEVNLGQAPRGCYRSVKAGAAQT